MIFETENENLEIIFFVNAQHITKKLKTIPFTGEKYIRLLNSIATFRFSLPQNSKYLLG